MSICPLQIVNILNTFPMLLYINNTSKSTSGSKPSFYDESYLLTHLSEPDRLTKEQTTLWTARFPCAFSFYPVAWPVRAYMCVCLLCKQVRYKIRAKELLKGGCNELLRPDFLNAMYNTSMGSKVTIWLQALLQAPGNLIPSFSIHPNTFFGRMIHHHHYAS